MKRLKRLTAMLLAAVVVIGCSALYASAANAGLVGYSGSRETVLINVTSEAGKDSDFVTKFPKKLTLVEDETEPPVEEPTESVRWAYQDIPRYFQVSYPDALYGSGTVESCGSSITALAMVASYLTGYEYLPDELARWFAGKADEDIARLNYAANALELPFEVSQEWDDTFAALQDGKCIILQMDQTSLFTDDQHFIVLKGMTEDGKILINDPDASHYLDEELEERFASGFEVSDISTGARYAWLFDKSQVPSDIARFTETVETTKNNRYKSLKLTAAEKQLLARVVAVNGYGECAEGQQAMIEVILNRLLSDQFPDELKEIVYGEDGLCEAALLNAAELTRTEYLAVERAINGPYILEKTVTDFSYTCHK